MSIFFHDRVRDFQIKFAQEVRDHPALPDEKTRALRRTLLAEEHEEFREAVADNDLVEIADALGDMIYILYGTANSYGIRIGIADPRSTGPRLPLDDPRVANLPELVRSAFNQYIRADEGDRLGDIADAMWTLAAVIFLAAHTYGIPLMAVFEEIHRSNLSKLDPETGVPLRRDDGKILKPPSYRPPDIARILAE